ncbi:MAG: CHASE2 domain-containing protein [Cyanobacteria bacterium J06558_2]
MKIIPHQLRNKYHRLKQAYCWIKTSSGSVLFLTITVTILVLGMRRLGVLQALELLTYDWMVNLQQQDEIDPRLLIVEITDKDIEKYNSYPLKDQTFAQLLQKLQQEQPKVIGFDIYREIDYPPGTDILRKELQQDNVVVIQLIGNGNNSVSPPPGIASEQIGFNDMVVDVGDDVLRRNLMYVRFGQNYEQEMYSFALRLSLKYLDATQPEVQIQDNNLQIASATFPDLKFNSGGYRLQASETAGKQILINYRSPNIAHRVTLSEVIEGKVAPHLIRDKVVLIGNTSPSIKDVVSTPYYLGEQSLMPGVVAHAQMVSQILSVVVNDTGLIWFWAEWVEDLWIWGWSLLGAIIAWKLRHPLSIGIVGIITCSSLGTIYAMAFAMGGWIPFIPAVASFAITVASVLGYKALYNLFYDDLTKLPNRPLFAQQLKKLQGKNSNKSSGFIAIIYLDLERFKLINDGLGYQAGDRILVATVQRLREHLDPTAILARVGADEFVIALKIASDASEVITDNYTDTG